MYLSLENKKVRIDVINNYAIRAIIENRFRRMYDWPDVTRDPNLYQCLSARAILEKLTFMNSAARQPVFSFRGSIHPFDKQDTPFRNDRDVDTGDRYAQKDLSVCFERNPVHSGTPEQIEASEGTRFASQSPPLRQHLVPIKLRKRVGPVVFLG
jgi:hypothetical protein